MLAHDNAISIIKNSMTEKDLKKEDLIKKLIEEDYLIQTDDGTFTLRSSDESELMHSRVGALTEAFEKFAIPAGIASIESPVILDLCSGLGYNALAALESNPGSRIYMFEFSEEMLFLGTCLKSHLMSKSRLDGAIRDYFFNRPNSCIQIHTGDVRMSLSRLPALECDVLFHDGFSPAKDPVLYTVEFLSLLKKHMKKSALLLSYSSSIPFRSALLMAGFHIGEGPSVGRKRGTTMASPNPGHPGISAGISLEDELLIALTTLGTPYRDPMQNLSGEEIDRNREAERASMRESCKYLSAKKIKKGIFDSRLREIHERSSCSAEAVWEMSKFLLTS